MADHFDLDPSRFLDRLREKAVSMSQRITEVVRPHAPVGKDRPDGYEGGSLRDGLAGKVLRDSGNEIEMAITSDQPYAEMVIKGTPPHVIEARNARALRFWAEGDHLVFTQRVNHPGTKPNPFFHKADEEIRQIVRADVGQAVRAVLRS